MANKMTRKDALKTMALGSSALLMGAGCDDSQASTSKKSESMSSTTLKGNINHSVCRWCYNDIELPDLAKAAKEMGLKAIDLLWPEEYHVAYEHGLECSLSFGSKMGIPKGFNDPANHEQLLKDYTELIPKAAEAGLKRVICFSGNRNGMDDETGLENCAVGLEPVVKLAQKHNITLVMELLNSKVNHPDYMCDFTPWGVKLVDKVGSDHFKLLYDIYHMQIMEGDIIATIRKWHTHIDHYHTGGVPGRNEIDKTQELYYPAIMEAIVETGYTGFVAQEFIPKNEDPLASLRAAVEICDV
jgi:hydroxypyruvate isomerase